MNERENEYRGCRLHRYLVAETTPAERQALREAIQRVNTEGATQIVLGSAIRILSGSLSQISSISSG